MIFSVARQQCRVLESRENLTTALKYLAIFGLASVGGHRKIPIASLYHGLPLGSSSAVGPLSTSIAPCSVPCPV